MIKIKTIATSVTIIASIFAMSTITFAEGFAQSCIDTTFIPDDMMNENSISPEEFTQKTGVYLVELGDKEGEEMNAQVDSKYDANNMAVNFVPNNIQSEKYIPPEQFIELTNISVRKLGENQADILKIRQNEKNLNGLSKSTIAWDKALYPYGIIDNNIHNLEGRCIESDYISYDGADTYSQKISTNKSVFLSMTPNDNKVGYVRVYINFTDKKTGAETAVYADILLTTVSTSIVIENEYNRDVVMSIALVNYSNTTRTGILKMETMDSLDDFRDIVRQ